MTSAMVAPAMSFSPDYNTTLRNVAAEDSAIVEFKTATVSEWGTDVGNAASVLGYSNSQTAAAKDPGIPAESDQSEVIGSVMDCRSQQEGSSVYMAPADDDCQSQNKDGTVYTAPADDKDIDKSAESRQCISSFDDNIDGDVGP